MGQTRSRVQRVWMVLALVSSAALTGVGVGPASAQITAVRGSAFGYQLNVTLFNGTPNTVGPTPSVSLPAGGSATAITQTAATGRAVVEPANFFTSGPIEVSTQGTPGGGSVTSSARITNLNTSQAEALSASEVRSTCTASGSGVSGSTTITGGTLVTDPGDDDPANTIPDHPATTVTLPANPGPNTVFQGHVHVGNVVDNFRIVFNEQIQNADGSLTVNAVHQTFLGEIARGDLILGQVVCGVTGTAQTTTTTPGATTTTTQTTTRVGGGAYGYFVSVGLFGGAPGTRGPAPAVTLPEGGSSTPVTDTAASATAAFGPATLFSSGQLEVSTQGTPGGSVTSSARVSNVNASTQEVLTAASLSSTCTASASGASGSTTLTGARIITSEGPNVDIDEDDTVVELPASPAPNSEYQGKIETVGDTFRYVFNEQIRNADGSITVNAAHQYLLGPTAVGEVIIGQSRCGSTTVSGGGGGGGGTQSVAGAGGGGVLASTGGAVAAFVALSLVLVVGGSTTTYWVGGVRWREKVSRRMPWTARGLLR